MNRHGRHVCRAFDIDAIDHGAGLKLLLDGTTDFDVLAQPVRKISLASKPFASPVFADLKAHADGIDFLAHYFDSFFSVFAAVFAGAALIFFSPLTTTVI